MKKIILVVLSFVLVISFVACQNEAVSEHTVIRVGATPLPHGEILGFVKAALLEKGIELEILEFTDYVTPNLALGDQAIDANFFQHLPYLEEFSKEHALDLSSIGTIHIEPLGLYSEKISEMEDLSAGALIAIPSDSVNGGRALILLENHGLIELKDNSNLKATEKDIVKNPMNLKFKAVEAAQAARILQDVDAAVINGNYALEAGLLPTQDALLIEGAESPYANVIAVNAGEEKNYALVTLVETLQSEKVKAFIDAQYGGGVVAAFGK